MDRYMDDRLINLNVSKIMIKIGHYYNFSIRNPNPLIKWVVIKKEEKNVETSINAANILFTVIQFQCLYSDIRILQSFSSLEFWGRGLFFNYGQ